MTDDTAEYIAFDELIALALARAADSGESPHPDVKQRLMSRVSADAAPLPHGFSFRLANDRQWLPHPVLGIRMAVLAENHEQGYVTLLLDVAPGTRFPAHHHGGAEECYVISGSLVACGRRIEAGDFHHADSGSDHGELWSDEGCRVLLVVAREDYLPAASR
jgi:anti-sigma factor ChrR (cupin superfamily)